MCHVSQRFDIFPVKVQTASVTASQFSKFSQILTTHTICQVLDMSPARNYISLSLRKSNILKYHKNKKRSFKLMTP